MFCESGGRSQAGPSGGERRGLTRSRRDRYDFAKVETESQYQLGLNVSLTFRDDQFRAVQALLRRAAITFLPDTDHRGPERMH